MAVLGASNYVYAEATESQELENWIGSHIRTFEFLGGVSKLVIPDNTRTGVNRACRYEPDLNRTYHELAMHYGVGVLCQPLNLGLCARANSRGTQLLCAIFG